MDIITHNGRVYRDMAHQIPIAVFLLSFNFPNSPGIQGKTVFCLGCVIAQVLEWAE